jgi:Cu-processing system ATP-binding protein
MNCAESPTMNVLEITQLRKTYGAQVAVDDLSLSMVAGESLAVIGHNGAGKTTLMKLILGLTRSASGSIERYTCLPGSGQRVPASDTVGFLPEIVAFPGTLTGRQMLGFYARLKNEAPDACDELLELVGLTDAAKRKINTYSKGMRQRLGLAQALLGQPSLLLLDEPTSGLDPFLRRHFYEIISTRQAAGASVMISSHALTEVEAQTDRIAIMKNGRLLTLGSLEQLRRKAALPIHLLVSCRDNTEVQVTQAVPMAEAPLKLGPNQLQFSCTQEQKIPLLHELTAQRDTVVDIIVRPPRLDDLYTHFVNGAAE